MLRARVATSASDSLSWERHVASADRAESFDMNAEFMSLGLGSNSLALFVLTFVAVLWRDLMMALRGGLGDNLLTARVILARKGWVEGIGDGVFLVPGVK